MLTVMRAFFAISAVMAVISLCPAVAETVPGLIVPLHEVRLGTPVEGRVAEVLVREGDEVAEGQPVVQLEADLEKIDLERAERVLEKAAFDHEAAQRLLKESIGTREEALKKKIEFELARLQRDAAQVRLDQKTVRAPLQGVVASRGKEPGESVLLHEVLMHIVHVREVEAQFYLPPALQRGLEKGKVLPLRVLSLPADKREISGRVTFVDPRVDAESGLCRVKIRLENGGLILKAGMRVEADFSSSSSAP